MTTKESVQLFNKSWDLYKKVVDADYMHHSFFHDLTEQEIQKKYHEGALKMLDLGCGDASGLVDILDKIEIREYAGYDLSEIALTIAKENLSFLGEKLRLVPGFMQDHLKEEDQLFDIIYSSYAIHHLDDDHKKILIDDIGKKLRKGGIFIYIDVFRINDMTRDGYIQKYCSVIDSSWQILDMNEKESIKSHLIAFDFPSSIDFLISSASKNGLELLYSNSVDEIHYFLCFEKK